jgi:hypothetical protein
MDEDLLQLKHMKSLEDTFMNRWKKRFGRTKSILRKHQ